MDISLGNWDNNILLDNLNVLLDQNIGTERLMEEIEQVALVFKLGHCNPVQIMISKIKGFLIKCPHL